MLTGPQDSHLCLQQSHAKRERSNAWSGHLTTKDGNVTMLVTKPTVVANPATAMRDSKGDSVSTCSSLRACLWQGMHTANCRPSLHHEAITRTSV